MNSTPRKNVNAKPLPKEVCLWVVGGKDGKVRKLRVSFRAIACGVLACGLVASAFLFVASDYARVQFARAQSYFHLKKLRAEKDTLATSNQALESRVQRLESTTQRAQGYEEQIKARLDELAAILSASDPSGLLAPQKSGSEAFGPIGERSPGAAGNAKRFVLRGSPKGKEARAGIGGAELDCTSDAGAQACVAEAARARLDPASLEVGVGPSAGSRELLGRIDNYIEVIRRAPLGLPAAGHVRSAFGYRVSPFHGGAGFHEGVDLAVSQGSLVVCTGDGVVRRVEMSPTYGLVVDVEHGDRVISRYAHLSKTLVREGEHVCRGEVVGLVGNSGRSTGPHLHYEVRVDGIARNPVPFIELAGQLAAVVQDSRT